MAGQLELFADDPRVPRGFRYRPEVLSPEVEGAALERLRELPFKEFEFQGFLGKRRVVYYGWAYDFNHHTLRPAEPLPDFLLPLRDLAAGFAGRPPEDFPHVLVTEYGVGAPIGWHRDRPDFGDVVGLSLLSACTFRMRRKAGTRWERYSLRLEPRSAYLLTGPARTEWEHSIPEAETVRYSLTFRTLRR